MLIDFSERMPWDLEKIEPNTFFPIASCVVFARRVSEHSRSLGNKAQLWVGKLEELEANGTCEMNEIDLADSSSDSFASPYADKARQGATIVPRVLYFVDVQESSTALVKGIKKVSPQRSSQEKEPWKSLHNAELIDAPIEAEHIWDIHLGETVAPYTLLESRKAILPVRRGEKLATPKERKKLAENNIETICGLEPNSMEPRMRVRWLATNEIWDEHKSSNNRLDLAGRLDYMGNLSAQLGRFAVFRLLYTSAGRPTATVLTNTNELIDYKLFWIDCETLEEAHYLAAIINSAVLEGAVEKFMSKGQFGARDLQKHLWRLPIPTYDSNNPLHSDLATLGGQLATEAAIQLTALQTSRAAKNKHTTITVARRELRQWLSTHPPAQQVEDLVAKLLE